MMHYSSAQNQVKPRGLFLTILLILKNATSTPVVKQTYRVLQISLNSVSRRAPRPGMRITNSLWVKKFLGQYLYTVVSTKAYHGCVNTCTSCQTSLVSSESAVGQQ